MKCKLSRPMRQDRQFAWGLALLLAQALMTTPVIAAGENKNNLHLYGALVEEPCVIVPGDEDIHLDFGPIIDKYLYLNTRTLGQSFEIRLTDCDLSLINTVKVTFQGTISTALPGLLAIDGRSVATGIAIGLETPAGKSLPFNKASDKYGLQDGSNSIAMKAYVQGEPSALASKTIGRGPFNAVATFSLEYE